MATQCASCLQVLSIRHQLGTDAVRSCCCRLHESWSHVDRGAGLGREKKSFGITRLPDMCCRLGEELDTVGISGNSIIDFLHGQLAAGSLPGATLSERWDESEHVNGEEA
jgi:hypothetical protein